MLEFSYFKLKTIIFRLQADNYNLKSRIDMLTTRINLLEEHLNLELDFDFEGDKKTIFYKQLKRSKK